MCLSEVKQKFMFVDEQALAKGVTRRPRDEKSAILSYAQVRRREREKRSQQEDGENKTPKHGDQRILAKSSPIHPHQGRESAQACDPLAQGYLADNSLDPFYCTVAGKDGRSLSFLRPALAMIEMGTFLAECFAPSRAIECGSRKTLSSTDLKMQRCVSDPTVMYSVLASGSTYLGWMRGDFHHTKMPEYYVGKVLEPVRLRILDANRPPDLWLLFSIYALAITEMWSAIPELWLQNPLKLSMVDPSRLEISKTHVRALCALVDHLGGWSNVDFFLLHDCILMDKFLALCEMNPPILPLTWDPGPLLGGDVLTSPTESLSMLLFGWRHTSSPQSQALTDLITDTIEYVRAAQSAWQGVPNCPAKKWLFLRHQALVYRLLHLQDLSLVDDCIRLATLTFLLISTEYKGAQVGASGTSRFLKSRIQEAEDSKIEIDDDLLLWCACTGAMGSQPWDEKPWFLDLAATTSHKIGVVPKYDNIRREISAFLFLETKQGVKLREVVKLINK